MAIDFIYLLWSIINNYLKLAYLEPLKNFKIKKKQSQFFYIYITVKFFLLTIFSLYIFHKMMKIISSKWDLICDLFLESFLVNYCSLFFFYLARPKLLIIRPKRMIYVQLCIRMHIILLLIIIIGVISNWFSFLWRYFCVIVRSF